jgi:hypothetical protein
VVTGPRTAKRRSPSGERCTRLSSTLREKRAQTVSREETSAVGGGKHLRCGQEFLSHNNLSRVSKDPSGEGSGDTPEEPFSAKKVRRWSTTKHHPCIYQAPRAIALLVITKLTQSHNRCGDVHQSLGCLPRRIWAAHAAADATSTDITPTPERGSPGPRPGRESSQRKQPCAALLKGASRVVHDPTRYLIGAT